MLKFEHVTKVYGGRKALDDLTIFFCRDTSTRWSDQTAVGKVP